MFQSDNVLVIINVVFGPNELMNFDWERMKERKDERMTKRKDKRMNT